jgi:leader peptidase (prepilin peptidase)/N-methyltransferase
MFVYVWLVLVFFIGAAVGSFLNVCIARLPLEKSILWPGSRCGACFQHIRWYDNLPLVSYWILRGRCRTCGAAFSPRYFVVELLTGLAFAGLFYLEVVSNIHGWPERGQFWAIRQGIFPWQWWAGYCFHTVLFCFLFVAAMCDLAGREVPLSLTLTGTFVGLVGSVLFPWPWPWAPEEALRNLPPAQQQALNGPWWNLMVQIPTGLYVWPVWGPVPEWLGPWGGWRLGLATGLAGMLAGTLLMRAVGFLFGTGLGREALGLGDADVMMMAGAFLGWQPIVIAFFVSAIPGLAFGIVQVVVRRDNTLPFAPSLALGILITMLGWRWMPPHLQLLFFDPVILLCLAGAGAGFMLFSSYAIRLTKR